MKSPKIRPSARERGILFFIVWFVIGGWIGVMTCGILAFGVLGGNGEPRMVSVLRSLCPFVLLPVLALGGLPAAIEIARGRPWKRSAVIAFAVCVVTWFVFFGLEYLGFL